MPTICSYINPCSSDFHALHHFQRLSCPQKMGVVALTTLLACSIIFSILAIPVFRYLVGRCTNQVSLIPSDKMQWATLFADIGGYMDRVVRGCKDKDVTRTKWLAVCKADQEQVVFEVDTPGEPPGLEEKIRQWLLQQFKRQKLEEITIYSKVFCLAKDGIYSGGWTTSSESGITLLEGKIQEEIEALGISLHTPVPTSADFFNSRILKD